MNANNRFFKLVLAFVFTMLLTVHWSSHVQADVNSQTEQLQRLSITRIAPTESAFGENHLEYRMWQVTQPLFDGRARWKKGMDEADKAKFKELAGEMLIHYGYETNNDW